METASNPNDILDEIQSINAEIQAIATQPRSPQRVAAAIDAKHRADAAWQRLLDEGHITREQLPEGHPNAIAPEPRTRIARARRVLIVLAVVLAALTVTTAILFATGTFAWYGGLHTPNAGITTPWGGLELRGNIGWFSAGTN